MHEEILTPEQKGLLPIVEMFKNDFGLVGGTAIALYLGHRRSIDFDLFTLKDFDSEKIKSAIRQKMAIDQVSFEQFNQLTMFINNVKFTFYKYPFDIKFDQSFRDFIKLPNLKTLGTMKAYALGRRAKWKDYVDLYFILKKFSVSDLSGHAHKLFGGEFNEKLFREQLSYFQDIDYSEEVEYLKGHEVNDKEVKKFLSDISLS